MFYISKSKYCLALQCQKINWLNKFKPDQRSEDPSVEDRMAAGNIIGDLAMGLFGDFVEVTAKDDEGKIDIPASLISIIIPSCYFKKANGSSSCR